jgi:hypothetical protein
MVMSPFFFRCVVGFVRLIQPRHRVKRAEPTDPPVVYLVHHQDLRGPLTTRAWFDRPIRPWVLNVFFDQKTCFQQYYHYTLTKRAGAPKFLAYIPAQLFSRLVSGLMPHLRAIPVFRGKREIIETFQISLAGLLQGDDLLICPDINYADKSPQIGDIHRGFLYLERYYYKAAGQHLRFVPLHISPRKHDIVIGKAITYADGLSFPEETTAVYNRILAEFRRLAAEDAAPAAAQPL